MNYTVELREVPEKQAVTVRFFTDMQNIASDIHLAYKEISELFQQEDYICTGEVFALYHDEAFSPDKIDVECGVTVDREFTDTERIRCRMIPGGLMAATFHKGPYEELCHAYQALMDWIMQNGYLPACPMRDIYLNDPAQVSPNDLETEILCPVRKP